MALAKVTEFKVIELKLIGVYMIVYYTAALSNVKADGARKMGRQVV